MTQPHVTLGIAAASLLCSITVALGAERAVVSLEGNWDRVTTRESADTPPASGWEQVKVPSTTWQTPVGGTHYVWYRREVEIPAGASGGKVFVDLRGARYVPRVYVDGKFIGAGSDGWSPTVVDITSAVTPGKPAKIAIRCQDRGAFFPEGFVLQAGMNEEQQRGKTLAPIGGYKESMGIWDRVLLRVTPGEYLDTDELVIVPSTRQSTLSLSGKAVGQDAVIAAEVIEGDKVVLNLPTAKVAQDGTWSLSGAFANARYWSPEDPHLYSLRLTMRKGADGPVLDQVTQRFGFKEIWTDGPDFYLNGVKRHLLGTSTWPNQGFEDAADIRKRVQNIKNSNANVFRTHTCPWQEAWLDAADEVGLMMIGESAIYTDGSGIYGYTDPRFWENYRKHIAGMIKRDRNRASLVMWSLGNEILFMNAQRFDKDLPKKQGDLVRYAKTVDPHHPYTFEADRDPDGAYDVIGLHYPHEMPNNRDYPNTADWLGKRIEAEAAGGMLGQASGDFYWDRKKPLYIGEYLWVPQDDYSVGTIWSGDAAFLNRSKYHLHAQYQSWYDQTIAYRRWDVSGMCPWTAFNFGGIQDPSAEPYTMQQEFYHPVAAFIRNRGLRSFTGETAKLTFDVLNDSDKPAAMELQLQDPAGKSVASQKLSLQPATTAAVTLDYAVPAGTGGAAELTSVLLVDGKAVHTRKHTIRSYARQPLAAPAGKKLVTYDPAGAWPGSVKTLDGIDVAGTILLIAPNALQAGAKSDVPTIGGGTFDASTLLQFLSRGGRAIVLEQQDLGPLNLGLSMRDSAATMAFAINAEHPVLRGLDAKGLSWWGEDNYVARKQIVRPSGGGARAIAVTGGPDWLANAPIVEMPVGSGYLVLIQAFAGAKMQQEPAAQLVVQNAVNYLAGLAPSQDRAAVYTTSAEFIDQLRKLGVASSPQFESAKVLILNGADDTVFESENRIKAALARGSTVYWHAPTPEAFEMLRGTLGAANLRVRAMQTGVTMAARDSALLNGISREDVLCTSKPASWDRKMNYLAQAAGIIVEADRREEPGTRLTGGSAKLTGAQVRDGKAVFDRRGQARFTLPATAAGVHSLSVQASTAGEGQAPLLMVEVNGEEVCWFNVEGNEVKTYTVQANLRQGQNDVAVRFVNGSEWGGGRSLTIESLEVGSVAGLGKGVEALTLPAAVATWKVGAGRVVIDGIHWDKPWPGQSDPKRFASGLFANMGVGFAAPVSRVQRDVIPLPALKLVGESAYFGRADDQLSCYNNATFETPFECSRTGNYRVRLTARGTPLNETMPRVLVFIDGKQVALLSINSYDDQPVTSDPIRITEGRRTLKLVYDNDASSPREDRNLFLRRVEFER